MEGRFPGVPRKFMAGGHELGYILPLSNDPEGGPSERSVAVFEQNFNQLFYVFNYGLYKFVVLSSDLELLQSGPEDLIKKKHLQTEFYQNEIACSERPVIIMIHDPDALASMWPFLEKHQDRIARVFSGHQHARWVNWIYPKICSVASSRILEILLKPLFNKLFPGKADAVWVYFQNNKNNAHIWKQLNLSIIPAPGGMMGIGGGFLVADLKKDDIKVRKIKAPKP
ncbi:MAG: hypothetical protein PHQ20_04100 [Candidatus Moranbacteria bacterium]|nr:hypothetical protein [Candidatus Moranbacteria bacterium]